MTEHRASAVVTPTRALPHQRGRGKIIVRISESAHKCTASEIPIQTVRGEPFDWAQDRPFDIPAVRRELVEGNGWDAQYRSFDWAQDRPFDFAQDRPFDWAQDRPFDWAQDRLVEPQAERMENIDPSTGSG